MADKDTKPKQTIWLERYGFETVGSTGNYVLDANHHPVVQYRMTRSQNIISPIVGEVVSFEEAQGLINAGVTVNISQAG